MNISWISSNLFVHIIITSNVALKICTKYASCLWKATIFLWVIIVGKLCTLYFKDRLCKTVVFTWTWAMQKTISVGIYAETLVHWEYSQTRKGRVGFFLCENTLQGQKCGGACLILLFGLTTPAYWKAHFGPFWSHPSMPQGWNGMLVSRYTTALLCLLPYLLVFCHRSCWWNAVLICQSSYAIQWLWNYIYDIIKLQNQRAEI